ncbi:MAG: hypothetical protein IPN52_07685 [Micrococcales bacterium]|nr:hypothetical protein [Micrococcales bacterium]
MTITVTDPDTALDGLRCQVDQLLGMDPAEWTLDQLQRTILDVHTLTQQLAAVQAKALASFDTRGGAQLAGHRTTGTGWRHPPAPRRGMPAGGVHTARALRDVLPGDRDRAGRRGPSPSTMSGRSAPRTAPSVMR